MTTTSYILPYPPSANTYWRKFRNRMILSEKGRAYKELIAHELRGCSPITEPFWAFYVACPPSAQARDVDNLNKALFDAMKGRAFVDDSNKYMRGLCGFWGQPCEDGNVQITLTTELHQVAEYIVRYCGGVAKTTTPAAQEVNVEEPK